ncbi:MAG: hypothetical protein U0350_04090 [Caldilineaceae bacterium]
MKHCPNPDCPFLHQYKMVAEFRDEVNTCPDCGAPLAPGEAPEIEPVEEPLLDDAYRPLFPANREPDLVTLCAVESEADAVFYKEQLELQGIPATIVVAEDEAEEEGEVSEEAPEEETELEDNGDLTNTGLYEVQVLRSDLLRATDFLDTLESDEMDEEEDTEAADEATKHDEGDEQRAVHPQWTDPVEDETPVRSTVSTPVTPSISASSSDQMGEKAPSRSTQWLLILVLVVVVIVIGLFLLNAFAK